MVLPLEGTTMRTAIGYVRVSSEEQADSGLGLDAQRQRIRAYCELKDLHLATIFEDPGVSGGKPLATRPGGSRLLEKPARRVLWSSSSLDWTACSAP
jgi:site-specific DNA recombinase